ncbi:MAG: YceD family protein [Inquilinaceae bacterium]
MTVPEFSRTLRTEEIGDRTIDLSLKAEPEERAALARRFELQAIDDLTAVVAVRREGGGVIAADGHLEAAVVQTCVVTLAPVPAKVSESFSVKFRPGDRLADGTDVDIDVDAEDWEPITGSTIDIGEVVAQHLSLALDPYPRLPDAALEGQGDTSDGPEEERQRPFAGLDGLLRKR